MANNTTLLEATTKENNSHIEDQIPTADELFGPSSLPQSDWSPAMEIANQECAHLIVGAMLDNPPAPKSSNVAQKIEEEKEEIKWGLPTPFYNFETPDFPLNAMPPWLKAFVEKLAASSQTPGDLAALLSLAVCSASVARNVRIEARSGWEEPLNIFAVVALPPANRKSHVTSEVTKPLIQFEKELIESQLDKIAIEKSEYRILESELAELEKRCAKAKPEDQPSIKQEAKAKAKELSARKLPVLPKLIVDDVTAEVLASILAEQKGRVGLFSAEGGIFDTLAGRYSNGTPNFDVLLKGHSGDDLRVDRRDRSEHVEKPALTIGLAVQPEVLRGLIDKPGFRGRGLIGRFLYSIPQSTIGKRKIRPTPMNDEIARSYQQNIYRLAAIEPFVNDYGEIEHRLIRLSKDADDYLAAFEEEIEPMLGEDGDLAFIGDWGGKLAGATVRLAGILHLAENAGNLRPKWPGNVSAETMKNAIAISRYLLPHARLAYAEMGADPKIEDAKYVLRWIKRTGLREFTERDAFEGTKGRFKQVAGIRPALEVLEDHAYIRPEEGVAERRRGRKSSPKYTVNPNFK